MPKLYKPYTQDVIELDAPTLVIDNADGAILCLDEYRIAVEFHHSVKDAFEMVGDDDIADRITLVVLPQEQEVLDTVLRASPRFRELSLTYTPAWFRRIFN